MNILNLETDENPRIVLDSENNLFEIAGRAIHNEPKTVFKPVFDWIKLYSENPKSDTVFNFKMDYFSTSSAKVLLDIMLELESIYLNGNKVLIKWHYEDGDYDMKMAGERYSEIVALPFDFVKVSNTICNN